MRDLECSDIVLRAILRATHIDSVTKKPISAAFMLREGEERLSVSYDQSPQECAAGFKKCCGVASLHVGRIRDIGLDVIADEQHHAGIVGLPSKEDNIAEAERLASRLQRQARLVATT